MKKILIATISVLILSGCFWGKTRNKDSVAIVLGKHIYKKQYAEAKEPEETFILLIKNHCWINT